jgi:hypothetical protein
MVDYDVYDELDDEQEGFWTRRQIVLTIIVLIMVITLLAYMATPLLRVIFGTSQSNPPPPTRRPLEQVERHRPPGGLVVTFSDADTLRLGLPPVAETQKPVTISTHVRLSPR